MYLNEMIGGVPFGFTYYPLNPGYPRPLFLMQMSFPRLLHGHNATILRTTTELQLAASKANLLLRPRFPWLSSINIEDLVLGRIDLVFDHPVGSLDQYYLDYLRHQTFGNKRIKTFPYVQLDFPDSYKIQGVEYRSLTSTNKSMFYSKFLECDHPSAKGSLRQEKKITKPRFIAQQLGITEAPKLRHITVSKVT